MPPELAERGLELLEVTAYGLDVYLLKFGDVHGGVRGIR
jgi:hypothetical protein